MGVPHSIYSSLHIASDQEIRLLTLLPKRSDGFTATGAAFAEESPLEGTLEIVSLSSSTPSYTALSYHWGTNILSEMITINGHKTRITSNLRKALLALRKETEPVILWVDGLCINQSDSAEKGVQVGLMLQIYSRAAAVDVWLGPAADDSDAAMAALADVGARALEAGIMEIGSEGHTRLRAHAEAVKSMGDVQDRGGGGQAVPPLDPKLRRIRDALDALSDELGLSGLPYAALTALTSRPYWTRVWIVQEFSVAALGALRLVCGSLSLSFEVFAAAEQFTAWHNVRINTGRMAGMERLSEDVLRADRALLEHATSSVSGSLSVLVGARRRFHGLNRGVDGVARPKDTLFELLVRTCLGHLLPWRARATDRRDLIYGVLSMARDCAELGIEISYGKEKTIEAVFADAARALIERGYMAVLVWAQQPPMPSASTANEAGRDEAHHDPPLRLPSWVPDFSAPIREPAGEGKYAKLYAASGPGSASFLPRSSALPTTQSSTVTRRAEPETPSPTRGLDVPLRLACYRVDTVRDLGTPWNESGCFDVPLTDRYFREIEAFLEQRPPPRPTAASPSSSSSRPPFPQMSPARHAEAIWRVPSGDQSYNGDRARATAATVLHAGYASVRALARIGDPAPTDGEAWAAIAAGIAGIGFAGHMYWTLLGWQHGRRPFISAEHGLVGLVPWPAERGDLLAVVEGASVPFCFRKREEGGWRLVGEAYVDGIMDGEALEAGLEREVWEVY